MRSIRLVTAVFWISVWGACFWLPSVPAYAQKIPALAEVPAGLPGDTQTGLNQRRQELDQEYYKFKKAADDFSAKTAEQQSDEEYQSIQGWRSRYIKSVKAFNEEVTKNLEVEWARLNPWAKGRKPNPDDIRVIEGIGALAKKLGWSVDKQASLNKALLTLGIDPDTWSDNGQIQRTWRDVVTRGQDADLVQEASQGGGLGFPGAGTQTYAQDCSVFALANATGLPYGVVAARAADLIRQGEWRDANERANPQKVMEQKGLMGGEVVMLAEGFGQAEVVPISDFAKTLKEGRPVLVGVVPKGGNILSGHEVVLTKTFQHGGETWYVMMDSNQGPQQQLFLSAKELKTMLKENGVAFRPDPNTTPKLLREGGDQ